MIPAQLKDDLSWREACIRNVSSHGMLLQLPDPPKRGSYVELRRDSLVIVARVVWTAPDRCGLRTQERLSIPAAGTLSAVRRPAAAEAGKHSERKTALRGADEIAEQASLAGRRMQFAAVGAVCAAAAGLIAWSAFQVIAAPVARITAALG